ncbi:MAG TPA: pitrilysin family protein [Armatimonadota bacterium]
MSIVRLEQVSLPYLAQPAQWATLDSGHQIIVVHKPGEVVYIQTLVRTGSVNETDENTGVSHFLEHLMFKGTERFPAGAFDRILEGIGAQVNAGTSKDYTQYYVGLPKGQDGEYYRLALDLHADMLLHALLPEEEIGPPFDPHAAESGEKRERAVVIEEIKRSKDNPWRVAIQQLTELLYPTHPYRREILGTAEVIATVPVATIRDYYRTWYQPAAMITMVAGDFPAERVIEDVERNFHFHATRPAPPSAFPREVAATAPQVVHRTMPLNVSYLMLGFLGPASDDLRAIIGLDMLSLIIGEGDSSRLQLRLVDQLPDTPFIRTGSSHWTLRDSSNVICYGIARPDAAERSFELLRAEIDRIHQEPPTPAEIEKAVTRLEAQFAEQVETAAGITLGLADSMARLNTPANYTEYLPILHGLTRDDLVHYAEQYLRADTLSAVTVAPEQGKESV